MRSLPRRILRASIIAFLGATLIALMVCLIGLFLLQTRWGKEQLRQFLTKQLQSQLSETISVDEVDTNVWSFCTLRGVHVWDPKQREVIQVGSVTVSYDLVPLWKRVLRIHMLEVKDARVLVQSDARGPIWPVHAKDSGTSAFPRLEVQVEKVDISVAAVFEGDLFLGHEQLEASLTVHMQRVLLGSVSVVGQAQLGIQMKKKDLGFAVMDGTLILAGTQVILPALHIQAEGQMNQLFPSAKTLLQEHRVTLDATISGPIQQLFATGQLTDAKQGAAVSFHGIWKNEPNPLQFLLYAHVSNVPVGVLTDSLPRARISGVFQLQGSSQKMKGETYFARVELHGGYAQGYAKAEWVDQSLQSVDVSAVLDIPKLERLSEEPIFSSLQGLKGQFHGWSQVSKVKEVWTGMAEVNVKSLRWGGLYLKDSVWKMSLQDHRLVWDGHLKEIRWNDLLLQTISVLGHAKKDAIDLHAFGVGHRTRFDVFWKGCPHVEHGTWLGVDGILQSLLLSRSGQSWFLQKPSRMTIRWSDSLKVRLEETTIREGHQEIRVQGQYGGNIRPLDVRISAKYLNVRRISKLFQTVINFPATSLFLFATLRGSIRDPEGTFRVFGQMSPLTSLGWQKTKYQLQATLKHRRVRGTLSVRSPRTLLQGVIDLVARRSGKVKASVTGRVPWQLLRVFFPDVLKDLHGDIDVGAVVDGTWRNPSLSLSLGSKLFRTDLMEGRDGLFTLSYENQRVRAEVRSLLRAHRGVMLGQFHAEAEVELPIRALFLTEKKRTTAIQSAPLRASLSLQNVEIGEWFRSILPSNLLLTQGFCDGSLQVSGTMFDPIVQGEFGINHLLFQKNQSLVSDLRVKGQYQKDHVSFRLDGNLQSHPVLHAEGDVSFPFSVKEGWRYAIDHAHMKAYVDVIPFDLATITNPKVELFGQMQGHFFIDAHKDDIRGDGLLQIEQLRLDAWSFPKVTLSAKYMDDHWFQVVGQIQGKQGTVSVNAQIKVPWNKTDTTVHLTFDKFDPGYEPSIPPPYEPRIVRGIFDGELDLSWPHGNWVLRGNLRGSQGMFGFRADPRLYRNLVVDLGFQAGEIDGSTQMTLHELRATAEVGSFSVAGQGMLVGGEWKDTSLQAHLENFPFSQSSLGMWFDADIEAKAETKDGVLQGEITALRGSARLPKLSSDKDLQSLENPAELMFVDERAVRETAKQEVSPEEKDPQAQENQGADLAQLRIHIPGPFSLKGSEIMAEVDGELLLAIHSNGGLGFSGYLHAGSGWAKLFDKRYDVQKARLDFDGDVPLNPRLDLSLSRDLPDARLYVDVYGSFDRPQTVVRTDPSIYDPSQLMAVLWGGDPTTQKTYKSGQQQGALGLLSSLIAGQFKKKLGGLVPWDTLQVSSASTSDPTDLSQTKLEVGRYFFDSFYLSYSYQFGVSVTGDGKQNSSEFRADWQFLKQANLSKKWQFLKNIELNTSYGNAGVGNIDMLLRWRF